VFHLGRLENVTFLLSDMQNVVIGRFQVVGVFGLLLGFLKSFFGECASVVRVSVLCSRFLRVF
jgi:hypothetical protein